LYEITILDANTTANTIVIYDASSYADATANNRVLGRYIYSAGSTRVIGGGIPIGVGNGIATNVGVLYVGDPGFSFKFTQQDGKPILLKKGIHIDSTDGANPFSVRVVWRRE